MAILSSAVRGQWAVVSGARGWTCRAQVFGRIADIEVVAAVNVDVRGHCRPQVGDVLVGDVETSPTKPVNGLAEQPGIEGGHAIDDQAEAQGLGGLVRELAVAHLAVVSEMDCVAQTVEGLTLVELASDPFAHFGALEVAEDEQCLD